MKLTFSSYLFRKNSIIALIGFLCGIVAIASCTSSAQENKSLDGAFTLVTEKDTAFSFQQILDPNLADGFVAPIVQMNNVRLISFLDSNAHALSTGLYLKKEQAGSNATLTLQAMANGIICNLQNDVATATCTIAIRHAYIDNATMHYCYSVYAGIKTGSFKLGDKVHKGQVLCKQLLDQGSIGIELRNANMQQQALSYKPTAKQNIPVWIRQHYYNPNTFAAANAVLEVPAKAKQIVLVIKKRYQMQLVENGEVKKTYEIGLSQEPIGPKVMQGDLRMPEGAYYLLEKKRGPFFGDYASYLGPCTIHISYPNTHDAKLALMQSRINQQQYDAIKAANDQKIAPPQDTPLGGLIVIHGWKGEWVGNGAQNMTWGCISMHNAELEKIYPQLHYQTPILIFP